MLRRKPLVTCAVAAITLVTACGSARPGTTTSATTAPAMPAIDHPDSATTRPSTARTVNVPMADIRYDVSQINVKVGETIRFAFENRGKLAHEAVIGDAAEQDAHEKEMAAMGDMPMNNSPTAISVDPGQTGELTYTFKTAGQVLIGCHQPGHYAAGMRLTVNVA